MVISPTTKLYLVTFKNFTNSLHTTVSNNKSSFLDNKETVYIDTSEPIIVKEQDIMKYKDFDIDSIKYVGVLLEEDTTLPSHN